MKFDIADCLVVLKLLCLQIICGAYLRKGEKNLEVQGNKRKLYRKIGELVAFLFFCIVLIVSL